MGEGMKEHNIVSVSGGKDSTALLLLAVERQPDNLQAVFADTGNEHEITYEYVQYLNDKVFPIRTVKADFTRQIAGKRKYVLEKWPEKLTALIPTKVGVKTERKPIYQLKSGIDDPEDDSIQSLEIESVYDFEAEPIGYRTIEVPVFEPRQLMTQEEAEMVIERALAALVSTGNPFLDLCIWKGRFPSSKAAFCSEELKRNPIINEVQKPLLDAGDDVISWQGVRRDESFRRSLLTENELKKAYPNGAELWNYRPIIDWTAEDCFAMHKKHGIKHNPLYEMGMGRVGCMPCINCRKDELLEISKRFPEAIYRIRQWEDAVKQASKRQAATFFSAPSDDSEWSATQTIDVVVEWAKTSRGGKQYDWLRTELDAPLCTSIYGLCE